MSRPTLKLARSGKPPQITRALLKQAVRHFRSDTAPRSVRRHNARQWIRAKLMLGAKHVLDISKPPVKWGTQKGITS